MNARNLSVNCSMFIFVVGVKCAPTSFDWCNRVDVNSIK